MTAKIAPPLASPDCPAGRARPAARTRYRGWRRTTRPIDPAYDPARLGLRL